MKIRLWLEWLVLFIAVPLVTFVCELPVSKFLIFSLPIAYAFVIYRWKAPAITVKEKLPVKPFILRIVAVSLGLFLFARLVFPELYLWFPLEMPRIWIVVMVFYPLLSALPQEFFYRRYYFWRYVPIMPKQYLIFVSSILTFGFLHIMYDNWVAVVLSTGGGVLFACSYARTRRLRYAWIEHAIYGQVIFTTGLGRFFYEPPV